MRKVNNMFNWIRNLFQNSELNELRKENERLNSIINRMEIELDQMAISINSFKQYNYMASKILRG